MDDKKIIKMEKEIVNNSGRLQSLKLPRDLSLGLTTKPKKQYQPNLNVSRNKDRTKEFLKRMEQKRKDKPTKNQQQQRNKNEKFDNNRFIQSDGVFSQGAGDLLRRPNINSHQRNHHRNDNNTTSNIIKPTINRKNWQINNIKNDDNCYLLDELNNYENYSDDEDMDEKSTFHALKLTTIKMKQLKTDTTIKTEPDTYNLNQIPQPFNTDQYDDESPAICLLKLPDSFAGKGLSDDPNCKQLFDYPLEHMLEGQIGKLILHQSGRMQIQIGRMHYHLEPEIINEAKEQLATIIENDGDNNISLALLGNITHDFVMFPNYDQF